MALNNNFFMVVNNHINETAIKVLRYEGGLPFYGLYMTFYCSLCSTLKSQEIKEYLYREAKNEGMAEADIEKFFTLCIECGLIREEQEKKTNKILCRFLEVEEYINKRKQISETKKNVANKRWNKEKAEGLKTLYHSLCPSLPQVQELTETRLEKSEIFLSKFTPEQIKEGFKKAEKSDTLKHGIYGQWKGANFEWLIEADNFLKVLEGNYDNPKKQLPKSSICTREELEASMNAEGGFDL